MVASGKAWWEARPSRREQSMVGGKARSPGARYDQGQGAVARGKARSQAIGGKVHWIQVLAALTIFLGKCISIFRDVHVDLDVKLLSIWT